MAPRNTQNGAAAISRRTTTKVARGRSSVPSRPVNDRQASVGTGRSDAPSAARWWAVPLSVLIIIVAFIAAYYPVARVQYREVRERARLTAELQALKARNQRLSTEVARLQTPEGVEDYARTQLGLVKRGEHVVVVRGGDGSTLSTATCAVPEVDSDYMPSDPVGPWTGVLDLVFGVR